MHTRGPLDPRDAKRAFRSILTSGSLIFRRHAREEMEKDGLTEIDCKNILRAGVVEEPELVNGRWRYRARSQNMTFVVELLSDRKLLVVTGWRERR